MEDYCSKPSTSSADWDVDFSTAYATIDERFADENITHWKSAESQASHGYKFWVEAKKEDKMVVWYPKASPVAGCEGFSLVVDYRLSVEDRDGMDLGSLCVDRDLITKSFHEEIPEPFVLKLENIESNRVFVVILRLNVKETLSGCRQDLSEETPYRDFALLLANRSFYVDLTYLTSLDSSLFDEWLEKKAKGLRRTVLLNWDPLELEMFIDAVCTYRRPVVTCRNLEFLLDIATRFRVVKVLRACEQYLMDARSVHPVKKLELAAEYGLVLSLNPTCAVIGRSSSYMCALTKREKLAFVADDRYLTGRDNEFVQLVLADVERFVNSSQLYNLKRQNQDQQKRALVFPPVSSYHRYLLHQQIQSTYPQLCTFSVGEGSKRRTVVTFQETLRSAITTGDLLQSGCSASIAKKPRLDGSSKWPTSATTTKNTMATATSDNTAVTATATVASIAAPVRPTRPHHQRRKPDQQVYVPPARARRNKDTVASQILNTSAEFRSQQHSSSSGFSDGSQVLSGESAQDTVARVLRQSRLDESGVSLLEEDIPQDNQQSPMTPLVISSGQRSGATTTVAVSDSGASSSGKSSGCSSSHVQPMMSPSSYPLVTSIEAQTASTPADTAGGVSHNLRFTFDQMAPTSSASPLTRCQQLDSGSSTNNNEGDSILDCLPTSYDDFETKELNLIRLSRQLSSPTTSQIAQVQTDSSNQSAAARVFRSQSSPVGKYSDVAEDDGVWASSSEGVSSTTDAIPGRSSAETPPDPDDLEVQRINESFEEQQHQFKLLESQQLKSIFYSVPNNPTTSDVAGVAELLPSATMTTSTTAAQIPIPDSSVATMDTTELPPLSLPSSSTTVIDKKLSTASQPADFGASRREVPPASRKTSGVTWARWGTQQQPPKVSSLSGRLTEEKIPVCSPDQPLTSGAIASAQISPSSHNILSAESMEPPTATKERGSSMEEDVSRILAEVAATSSSSNTTGVSTGFPTVVGRQRKNALAGLRNTSSSRGEAERLAFDVAAKVIQEEQMEASPTLEPPPSTGSPCYVDEETMKQIEIAMGQVVVVETPAFDYFALGVLPSAKDAELTAGGLGHVVEVTLSDAWELDEVKSVLRQLDCGDNFSLERVDELHLLACFAHANIAQYLPREPHHQLRLCPLADASPQSKRKAKLHREFLRPFVRRPTVVCQRFAREVEFYLGKRPPLAIREKRQREEESLLTALREDKEARRELLRSGSKSTDVTGEP